MQPDLQLRHEIAGGRQHRARGEREIVAHDNALAKVLAPKQGLAVHTQNGNRNKHVHASSNPDRLLIRNVRGSTYNSTHQRLDCRPPTPQTPSNIIQHINTKEDMLKYDLLRQHIQQQKGTTSNQCAHPLAIQQTRAEQRKTPGAGQRVWAFTLPQHLKLYPNSLSSPPSLSSPTTLYLPLPTQTILPLHT